MIIFWTFVIGAVLGYLIGHYVRPNMRLRQSLEKAKQLAGTMLQEGHKGVYKTIVTDNNQTSELIVEVKELAVTKGGQVKVEYISANYKNPDFRTRKGEALLQEVRDLLGDYLPLEDIEWYETTEQHERIKRNLHTADTLHKQHFGE
ncbi:hypothetical protein [Pontibacter burrus]|uniref:hypothetical protein n=1 Tax=Pontibacter burrus TaxID=2704466 RepID=UPI001953158F|nr:hypothetical protein [Pontibacter burrus]